MTVANEGLIITDDCMSFQAVCADPISPQLPPDIQEATMTSDPTFVELDLAEIFPSSSNVQCAAVLLSDLHIATMRSDSTAIKLDATSNNVDCAATLIADHSYAVQEQQDSLMADHPYAVHEQKTMAMKRKKLYHSQSTRFVVKAVHCACKCVSSKVKKKSPKVL